MELERHAIKSSLPNNQVSHLVVLTCSGSDALLYIELGFVHHIRLSLGSCQSCLYMKDTLTFLLL